MKQQLLIGGFLLSMCVMTAQESKNKNSQNGSELQYIKLNHRAKAIKRNIVTGTSLNQKSILTTEAAASPMASGSWTNISTSMNIYGLFYSNTRPLQYNPNVNAVSFVHRKGSYTPAMPDDNSGAIMAMISTNWGASWDSTCFYSSAAYPGRYPQGAIYSAPGNTNIANAYIVGSGPVLGGGGWGGNFFASKQLGTGNYNMTASGAPNAMQVLTNFAPYPAMGRFDYATYGFTSTDDGAVRSLGVITDDFNNINDVWGYMMVKGTFNAGTFNWTGDSVNAPVVLRTDGTHHMNFTPVMAWSQDGQIGYMITIGAKQGATGSNVGYQPIIYKTTNSGTSWSLLNGIDFNSPQYATVLNRLEPVPNSTLTIPYFWESEGIDATVDANGKLHIVGTIVSGVSAAQDSLDYYDVYDTEQYNWPFTPGKMPYLYDFYGDGSAPWNFVTVDSITSQGPASYSGDPGFNENPWDDDAGFKPRSDSRIQVSRTPDGKFILYTWAESNPAFTNGSLNWNNIPDIKVRAMDVTGVVSNAYAVSTNEIEASKLGNNLNVVSKAFFHYTSPVSSTYTLAGTTVSVTLPLTATNSSPLSQLTENTHWYSSSVLNFNFPIPAGIMSRSKDDGLNVYPNPAQNEIKVALTSTEGKSKITLLNSLGQVLKQAIAETSQSELKLDISNFETGVYILTIENKGITKSTKFIKQ